LRRAQAYRGLIASRKIELKWNEAVRPARKESVHI
jgi:hypothetical protein